MAGCEYAPELVERLGARTNGASRPADIETAMNETLDSPPRLLPTDSSFPALSCRRQEVARWVWAHNRKVDADARAHRCRQQRSTRGAASCRNNFVRDTTAAAEFGADRSPPRFDAPDSAHYAYRRTLLPAVPGTVVLLLITPLAALSTSRGFSPRSCVCREGPQDCSSVR
jgi:hypothetical protein